MAMAAAAVACAALVGCGGDDNNGGGAHPSDGGADAKGDVAVGPDGAPQSDDGGGGDSAMEGGGGDGGACNFATFVLGLIHDHTNATDPPSTDLGQACVDDQDQAEYKSLFP
jgi:hypothetical protein